MPIVLPRNFYFSFGYSDIVVLSSVRSSTAYIPLYDEIRESAIFVSNVHSRVCALVSIQFPGHNIVEASDSTLIEGLERFKTAIQRCTNVIGR